MDNTPIKYHPWSDRLAMDIALCLEGSGEGLLEILTRHGMDMDMLGRFNSDSVFLAKVGHLREEVREKGMTFRLKAKAQAEELLVTSWTLIHSPDVSAAVKADLIKSTVKWGGLEPQKDMADAGNLGGVTIQINLPAQVAHADTNIPKIIEGEVVH
jgi:hypothetical protein